MFDSEFIANLEQINTHRNKRDAIARFLILKNDAIPQMLLLAEKNQEIFAKAMRAVEIVGREKPLLLFPHIDFLLKLSKMAKTDAQVRPMAKIMESITECFFKNEKAKLNEHQLNTIAQICFDWLISQPKTAPKAYSMNSLYLLSNEIPWIKAELKLLLEQNLATETAGYRARGRMLLKKMK